MKWPRAKKQSGLEEQPCAGCPSIGLASVVPAFMQVLLSGHAKLSVDGMTVFHITSRLVKVDALLGTPPLKSH